MSTDGPELETELGDIEEEPHEKADVENSEEEPHEKADVENSEEEPHENVSAASEELDNTAAKNEINVEDEPTDEVKVESECLFDRMLNEFKTAITVSLQEEDNLEEHKTVKYRYKMACIKYKVFPLKNCIDSIDSGILDLSDMNIGSQAFRPVLEALLFSGKLTHLIIPGNRLGIDGLKYVSCFFLFNSTITHLDLANNGISSPIGDLIQKILANGYNLEFLNLSENGLGDKQMLTMLDTLNDTSVQELNLSFNNLHGGIGIPLGKCLSTNSTLVKLDLGHNKLRMGAAGLFLGLKGNSCLKFFNLRWNEIDEKSSPDLGKFLEANSSVEELDLSYNKFTNQSMNHISRGVKANNTLKMLNLSFNPIRAPGAQTLINSVAAADNKIEDLNLLGIRVNLPFLKILHIIQSSERKIDVKYGNRVRCELCAGYQPHLHEDSPLMQTLKRADGLGMDLKVQLQKIHARFLVENRAQMDILKAENKGETEKSGVIFDDYPRMQVDKFIHSLETSALKATPELAEKLANIFVDEAGTVDIAEIIAKIPLRIDILELEPELPKEIVPSKDKGKKKK